jgi:hypothetical protein
MNKFVLAGTMNVPEDMEGLLFAQTLIQNCTEEAAPTTTTAAPTEEPEEEDEPEELPWYQTTWPFSMLFPADEPEEEEPEEEESEPKPDPKPNPPSLHCNHTLFNMRNDKVCAELDERRAFWSGFMDGISPQIGCPLRQGSYTLNNATLDLTTFLPMKLGGHYRTTFHLGAGPDVVFCVEFDTEVSAL